MNSYDIYEKEHESTILYHAVAENEQHVKQLADEANIDIEGLIIELERTNVVDELHRPFNAYIADAQVH